MSKKNTQATTPQEQETQPKEAAAETRESFPLTLEEFCIRLSRTDKRVELIGAFNFVEKRAGRIKDTEAAFAERFDKFANQKTA